MGGIAVIVVVNLSGGTTWSTAKDNQHLQMLLKLGSAGLFVNSRRSASSLQEFLNVLF